MFAVPRRVLPERFFFSVSFFLFLILFNFLSSFCTIPPSSTVTRVFSRRDDPRALSFAGGGEEAGESVKSGTRDVSFNAAQFPRNGVWRDKGRTSRLYPRDKGNFDSDKKRRNAQKNSQCAKDSARRERSRSFASTIGSLGVDYKVTDRAYLISPNETYAVER